MIEFGIVKFFNGRYGVIEVVNHDGEKIGEELFFDNQGGRFISDFDGGQPTFCEPDERPRGFEPLRPPYHGDKLVFERMPGEGGKDKASPWGHAKVEYAVPDDYDAFVYEDIPSDERGFLPYWLIADLRADESEVISLEGALRSPNRRFCGNLTLAREAGELHPRDFAV